VAAAFRRGLRAAALGHKGRRPHAGPAVSRRRGERARFRARPAGAARAITALVFGVYMEIEVPYSGHGYTWGAGHPSAVKPRRWDVAACPLPGVRGRLATGAQGLLNLVRGLRFSTGQPPPVPPVEKLIAVRLQQAFPV